MVIDQSAYKPFGVAKFNFKRQFEIDVNYAIWYAQRHNGHLLTIESHGSVNIFI